MNNRTGSKRRWRLLVVAATVLTGSIVASPADAVPGHTSCQQLAEELILPLAHVGSTGDAASEMARGDGLRQEVTDGHLAFCEPKS